MPRKPPPGMEASRELPRYTLFPQQHMHQHELLSMIGVDSSQALGAEALFNSLYKPLIPTMHPSQGSRQGV